MRYALHVSSGEIELITGPCVSYLLALTHFKKDEENVQGECDIKTNKVVHCFFRPTGNIVIRYSIVI